MTHVVIRSRRLALAVLCTGMLMIILDGTIVSVALPAVQADLGFTPEGLAWTVNAYLVPLGGLLLLAGRLGDLYGRRRMLVAGLLLFVLASLLCGLAVDASMLVLARFGQGVAAAMASAVVLGMIVALFPEPAERARAIGVYAFVGAAGASLGTLLGGLLTETVGWRWIFLVNVPIGLVAAALAVRTVPADRPARRARADVLGGLLVTAGLMVGVLAIVGELDQAARLGLGAAAAGLLAAFLLRQRLAAEPLVALRVFGSRAVSGGNAAQLLMVAGMLGFQFVGALYLQRALGYPPAATGLAMLPIPVLIAVVSLGVAGRLVARFGARRVLLVGQLLLVLGLLLLARAPTGSYLVDVLPAFAVLGLGAGLALPAVTTVIMSEAGPDDAGLVSGLASTSQQVGGALGVAVLAALAAARSDAAAAAGAAPSAALLQGSSWPSGPAPRWSRRRPRSPSACCGLHPAVRGRTWCNRRVLDDAEPATGPLAGLLVADFSRILAGPYATMLLADLGATVIKVEGPGAGDDTRTWSPPTAPDGTASYYLSINRNKRSIVLDLTDAGDVELARRLAARADVLVENFKPGGLRRFGLDHETVAAANPAIIYCSISGFGAVPAPRGAARPCPATTCWCRPSPG